MASRKSTGDGDSETEKYPETKKRVNKMRKHLDRFELENPEQKNRITKIRRHLDKLINKLEEEDEQEEVQEEIPSCYRKPDKPDVQESRYSPLARRPSSWLLYDRGNSTVDANPFRVRFLKNIAKIAIGYFNKQSPIRYSVVDMVRATQHVCAGRYFRLTFTAKPEVSEETETFEAKVCYRIGQTNVDFVKIVAT
ncbi:hypothetical protein ABFS83_14G065200 [Erythranthe nasuta]